MIGGPWIDYLSYGCVVCPADAKGYAGFECDTAKGLLAHFEKEHHTDASKAVQSLSLHLNFGGDGGESRYDIKLDGKLIAVKCSGRRREKKPRKKKSPG